MIPHVEKPKVQWGVPLVMIATVYAGWLWLRQPSPAENEASAHAHMEANGYSPRELCEHAKIVENAFAREGKKSEMEHWAFMRQSQCISADACDVIVGGCVR